jgi:hypothetical protein
MAVKKIYSDYQINSQEDLRWLQIRIAELRCLNDEYFIAQRDAHNQRQKDEWNNQIERIKKYTEMYYFTTSLKYRKPRWIERSELAIQYFRSYSIHEITRNKILSDDLTLWTKPEQPEQLDEILDPKNIRIPDEPVPIHDLQYFKEPVQQKIRELESKIEEIKAEASHAMLASQHHPILLGEGQGWWLYKNRVYKVTDEVSSEEKALLILDFVEREQRKFRRLKNRFSEKKSDGVKYERTCIPEAVRIAVWRRDQGRCARCGSRENLEYDHIVPVSKGGGNTERNIELLCQDCNRAKGNRIE